MGFEVAYKLYYYFEEQSNEGLGEEIKEDEERKIDSGDLPDQDRINELLKDGLKKLYSKSI